MVLGKNTKDDGSESWGVTGKFKVVLIIFTFVSEVLIFIREHPFNLKWRGRRGGDSVGKFD